MVQSSVKFISELCGLGEDGEELLLKLDAVNGITLFWLDPKF